MIRILFGRNKAYKFAEVKNGKFETVLKKRHARFQKHFAKNPILGANVGSVQRYFCGSDWILM